jgi:hypothetical protein
MIIPTTIAKVLSSTPPPKQVVRFDPDAVVQPVVEGATDPADCYSNRDLHRFYYRHGGDHP